MLRNHLRLAVRHLRRYPGYVLINVLGLGLGIAVCLLAGLYVRHEARFDRFHADADRLFRAWIAEDIGGVRTVASATPIPLGPTLLETFPEVDAAVRVDAFTDLVGDVPNAATERVHFADPSFFRVFSFPLLRGDPDAALAERNSVVLTTAAAARYFPDRDPLGASLTIAVDGVPQTFTVTGIAEEPPVASSIRFDLVVPYAPVVEVLVGEQERSHWRQIYGETYVRLRPGATAAALAAKLPHLVRTVVADAAEAHYEIGLQPITDIHLNPDVPPGLEPVGDPRYVRLLALVAVFVLLIASINFVMLSVGQAARRAREVGVRKALGAGRGELMRQFWGEAFGLVGLAALVGLGLAQLALPSFNALAGSGLDLRLDPEALGFLVIVFALVGFGAGGYPAVVLAGFRPDEALRGRLAGGRDGGRSLLRRGLVVAQFALSILLLVGTIAVVRQVQHLRTMPLGFAKEEVVVIPTGLPFAEAQAVVERLRTALAGHDGVTGVSDAAFSLDQGWLQAGYTDPEGVWRTFNMNWGAADFGAVMGVELAAGRHLSRTRTADSSRIVVNEALVRAFGWPSAEAALGRALPGGDFPPHEIVGVARDFNYASLRERVAPAVLALGPDPVLEGVSNVTVSASSRRKAVVRIRGERLAAAVALLEETWAEVAPGLPFDFYFLDDAVDAQYRQEERLARIVGTAAGLAISIACLGLFGLATLSVTRRTKEIGIRKVLGASVPGLVGLLCGEFARLVVVAFVLAAPVAYLAVEGWLARFAYRIDLGAGLFLFAGGGALLIALLTVGYHALRAALADPVRALRYE